jgi:VWFA-related protein
MFRRLAAITMMLSAHTVIAQPRFQATSPLVLVPVSVTDKKGVPIDGLHVEDFVLSDEGVRQTVRMDTADTWVAPVSVVVAVQSSSISSAALAKINKVGGMIQPLIAGDRGTAAVLAFDDEIRVLQEFTSNSTKISAAFRGLHGRPGTSARMLDAVMQAVEMFDARPRNHRRVMILLSEAHDRGSATKLADAIEKVQRAGMIVYPATYSAYLTPWTAKPEDAPPTDGNILTALGDLFRKGQQNTAEALARASGGERISFNTLNALENALNRMSAEIHSQYLLSFAPAAGKRGFHRLEVSVPERPEAAVRARAGYWVEDARMSQ